MTSSSTQGAIPIVQLLLPEQGRSQAQRLARALHKDYVAIEERNQDQLFDILKKLAQQLKFYSNNPNVSDADWTAFFPFEFGQANEWLAENNGKVEPHLALIKVFLDQFITGPVAEQNNLQQAYIDFYYEQVLRFTKQRAVPEHAHLVLALKKGAAKVLVGPQDKLIAGKREDGSTIFVQPIKNTVINNAQVVEMRSVFTPMQSPATVKVAPIANSADGLGENFDGYEAQWSAFGHDNLPTAEVGFALSSPILSLAEGRRLITLNITFTEAVSKVKRSLNSVFKVFLSSNKGWTNSRFATASVSGKVLSFSIELDESEAAVVPYSADLHQFSFDTVDPVIQCVVDKDAQNSLLADIYQAHIESIAISVEVSDVRALNIVSDIGPASANSAFLPFGPSPQKGSVFSVNSSEVFSKRLKEVTANLSWKNAQTNLANLYSGYSSYESMPSPLSNSYFTANASFTDGEGRQSNVIARELFDSNDAKLVQSIIFSEESSSNKSLAVTSNYANSLGDFNSKWAKTKFSALALVSPQFSLGATSANKESLKSKAALNTRNNGLRFTLNKSFFHDKYRKVYLKNVIAAASDPNIALVSEPYTPELASVSLNYSAYTRPNSFTNGSAQTFANDELRLFHLDCFGQRREHAHQRQQLDFVDDKRIGLFAAKTETGAFFIGLSGLLAGDSCQLLFQVLEGSADPSLSPAKIVWSVLCDNYFQTLNSNALLFDSTDNLQTSGIVSIVLPKESTTEHTLMPKGLVWLKLSINGSAKSVCKLRTVHSNAIEVVGELAFESANVDVMAAGSISKFEKSRPNIKSLTQPYDGFGGASEESADDFSARVSARLRHKGRALSSWDFESMVLEHFGNIHRVKALAHSQPGNWRSPGNVTILVVPYINVSTAAEPLTPKVSIHTINEVRSLLASRCAMQVKLHVINPSYIKVRMTLQVAFVEGTDINFYIEELNKALQTFFAPWSQRDSAESSSVSPLMSPQFGGRIYKSVVLDFIEEQPYVDYITHVAMQASFDGINWENDANEVKPNSPDQIITSALKHSITQVSQ